MARASSVPRSVWPLLIAAAVLGGWLLRDGAPSDRPAPLIPLRAEQVAALTVDAGQRRVELRRAADGWELAGPERDFVQPGAVDDVVAALATARRDGTPLPPDPAYGLDAPDALRVTVADADGRTWSVTLGALNPVTGTLYMRDADGVPHLAEPEIRERLARLPDSVRARSVWPPGPTASAAADTVRVRREGGIPFLFIRDDLERWWWRVEPAQLDQAGAAAAYAREAVDRLRSVDGRDFWLADERRLRNLLTELDGAQVLAFHPDERPLLGDDGRTAPLLLAVSVGGERRGYVIGAEAGQGRVDAWRRPARRGFETRGALRERLDAPLSDWLFRDALTVRLAMADSFALALSDEGSVTAYPVEADPDRPQPLREGWAAHRGARSADDGLDDVAYLVDRLEILRVLPRSEDPGAVFDAQPRLRVTTWQRGPGLPREQSLEIGVNRERTAVVAWRPDDGLVMEVPNTLLVSGRNLVRARSASRE